jgi:hypothetical protein
VIASRPPAVICEARHRGRAHQLGERGEHARRSREQIAAIAVLAACQVADAAAGLRDEQVARGRVPGRETDFPESVESTGRDICEVERRGARPAHARGRIHHALERREVGLQPAAVLAVREPGADERALEPRALRHAQPPAVEQGAGAALRREQLAPQRVEHDGDLRAPAVAAGDRHGELREAVQEIRGAVEGSMTQV